MTSLDDDTIEERLVPGGAHSARHQPPAAAGDDGDDGHQPDRRHRRQDRGQGAVRLPGARQLPQEAERDPVRLRRPVPPTAARASTRASSRAAERTPRQGGTTKTERDGSFYSKGKYKSTSEPVLKLVSATNETHRCRAEDQSQPGRRRRGQLQERLLPAGEDGRLVPDRPDPERGEAGTARRRPAAPAYRRAGDAGPGPATGGLTADMIDRASPHHRRPGPTGRPCATCGPPCVTSSVLAGLSAARPPEQQRQLAGEMVKVGAVHGQPRRSRHRRSSRDASRRSPARPGRRGGRGSEPGHRGPGLRRRGFRGRCGRARASSSSVRWSRRSTSRSSSAG